MAESNPLEQVTGGPPHAPHVPPIDDVLGPPPRPPTLGGRGHSGLFSPSRAIGRTLRPARETPTAAPAPAAPAPRPGAADIQRALGTAGNPDPNAATLPYRAPRGMGRKPANPRNRAQAAQKASSVSQGNAQYSTNPNPQPQQGFTTSQRQKRAAGWAGIAATMNELRANPSGGGSSGGGGGTTNP